MDKCGVGVVATGNGMLLYRRAGARYFMRKRFKDTLSRNSQQRAKS